MRKPTGQVLLAIGFEDGAFDESELVGGKGVTRALGKALRVRRSLKNQEHVDALDQDDKVVDGVDALFEWQPLVFALPRVFRRPDALRQFRQQPPLASSNRKLK